MLQITGLTHSYADGHLALDGLDLTVPDGELLSIVGPSGCGKSTLLRCIAGLISPSGGTLTLDGAPINGVPDDLAVVFQDYSRSLFPWLTVRDNVALPLRRRGMARAERRAAADRALESVGLPDAGRKYPWQLSGGMQQRVSIARALAYRPSLMLMDEPFGSVDAQTREDLEDLVLQVHRTEKMTILLVTHDIDESVYVGDRVVVLNRAPARVHADLRVELPSSRDQIETRGLPEFVRLRAEVGRLVRGGAKVPGAAPAAVPAAPGGPEPDAGSGTAAGQGTMTKAERGGKPAR
ncbi:NitT/TauT family transport system ATP-binding protein [Actinomadura meyerae]|jgi:NitT/TauT family transport system ATP-binding protein|uniref:NitT/TauT family transport system ATP-binding protein n=1 Tax=Actinomadura meyerae TaxID=240840 RepID=A0A239HHB1_9ACTN|nr:ABC transporter ATP-binding protein [Actinomadura meyerae]SNS79644.1 NitT/TauT family transport system ATP-binding protein [Actinomadura meyerae]